MKDTTNNQSTGKEGPAHKKNPADTEHTANKENPAGKEPPAKIDPPVFATLIHSISQSALIAMGQVPEMKEKQNKALAEFNIELLLLLKNKTKGNLTAEENQLMDTCVQDLQIMFAQQ